VCVEQQVFCRKMSGDDDDHAQRRVECRSMCLLLHYTALRVFSIKPFSRTITFIAHARTKKTLTFRGQRSKFEVTRCSMAALVVTRGGRCWGGRLGGMTGGGGGGTRTNQPRTQATDHHHHYPAEECRTFALGHLSPSACRT